MELALLLTLILGSYLNSLMGLNSAGHTLDIHRMKAAVTTIIFTHYYSAIIKAEQNADIEQCFLRLM